MFYGQNTFHFVDSCDFIYMLEALPLHNFNWLKELTMCVPLTPRYYINESGRQQVRSSTAKSVENTQCGSDELMANTLFEGSLEAIGNTPYLRKMNLILPPGHGK